MTKTYPLMDYLHHLKADISHIERPQQLNFPHQYQAHPLAKLAAEQIQTDFLEKPHFDYGFGNDPLSYSVGKMFGVLVVELPNHELAFLTGFSGKIGDRNNYDAFVPPIYDTLNTQGFFKLGESQLNVLNAEILDLETGSITNRIKNDLDQLRREQNLQVTALKSIISNAKAKRDEDRALYPHSIDSEALKTESKIEQLQLKALKKTLKLQEQTLSDQLQNIEHQIKELKTDRMGLSQTLQKQLFESYQLVNQAGEQQSMHVTFENFGNDLPPSGSGECALPKLLQFAFLNNLKPICFAEFWWGKSPIGEIRIHKEYYPACRSKCEPILNFMLKGLQVEPNPILNRNRLEDESLKILYEDDHYIALSKPSGILSVAGKTEFDCIQWRLNQRFPQFPEIILAHRLDMDTSGILLACKTQLVYAKTQRLFLNRKVLKTYEALLNGLCAPDHGTINLPLRVDLDHRPHQMVCYEHGKSAQTRFVVLERRSGRTRIEFFPLTGRTHQLRVHAAHPDGLGLPIVGDDLYGQPSTRLCLHAKYLEFLNPFSQELVVIRDVVPF